MVCRAGDRLAVEPVGSLQSTPHSDAFEPLIVVARVARGSKALVGADLLQLRTTPGKQGPDEPDVAPRRDRARPHASKTAHARAPVEAHEKRLGLVVGVMSSRESFQPLFFCPITEQAIALATCPLLDRGVRKLTPARCECRMRHRQATADFRHYGRFSGGL